MGDLSISLEEMNDAAAQIEAGGVKAFDAVSQKYGNAVAQLLLMLHLRRNITAQCGEQNEEELSQHIIEFVKSTSEDSVMSMKLLSSGMRSEAYGQALQVVMPNGKYFFERINPVTIDEFEKRGWVCKLVRYTAPCMPEKINEIVHRGHTVVIDGVSSDEIKTLIASPDECLMAYN